MVGILSSFGQNAPIWRNEGGRCFQRQTDPKGPRGFRKDERGRGRRMRRVPGGMEGASCPPEAKFGRDLDKAYNGKTKKNEKVGETMRQGRWSRRGSERRIMNNWNQQRNRTGGKESQEQPGTWNDYAYGQKGKKGWKEREGIEVREREQPMAKLAKLSLWTNGLMSTGPRVWGVMSLALGLGYLVQNNLELSKDSQKSTFL